MPFVPPRPVSDVTLVQHVKDKNDPHGTLKRAKQVRMLSSYPSGSDLDMLNDGDLVIVYSTGVQYRVSVKDVDGSRVVSLVELLTSAATKADVDAKADKATTLAGYGITDAATKEELADKADIVDGKVPAAQLPSYVDDVLEYDTVSAFPATGESGKIYVAKDTNLVYRWSGTQYVEISPSPAFDNTVTETSQNGVKSSGIWSWVKSLLPHWLTSGYAEPATVESVANKRDKDDLAVYSVTRTENTDWTWTSENAELAAALNEASVKPIYDSENHFWVITGTTHWGEFYYNSPGVYDVDALSVRLAFITIPGYVDYYATATRPRYLDDETLGPAKPNQQLAAVATDDAAKPADGSLMKYDAANDRFVKATAGTDYADEATGTDRQVVRGSVFDETKWNISVASSEYAREADHAREAGLVMWSYVEAKPTTLSGYGITDAAPLSMISATDTTFASAVRAVPTTDMPEDVPTDWGTYGTVGAALAALAAFVKWAKAKIVAVIGDDGKPTDQFATDLLGKQVANVKANTVSLAAAYSETKTYAVGDAVTHDGKLYKCAVVITTAEAWTPAHWTETTVATLWNNADTTSYGGQN